MHIINIKGKYCLVINIFEFRAMNALQKWRKEQNITQKRNSSTKVKDLTPYDTNPAYNAYMSREDPSEEISKELQQQQPECDKTDVEAMIRDIIMQLNTARENVVNENNPEERVKNAEHELNLVSIFFMCFVSQITVNIINICF